MRIVPEDSLVYGLQLPVQSQSELYVADLEGGTVYRIVGGD